MAGKKRKKFINNSMTTSTVNIDLSIDILDQIIVYLFLDLSQYPMITRKSLSNIENLFDILDKKIYEMDESLIARINFIQKVVKAEIHENIFNPEMLIQKTLDGNHKDEIKESILPMLDNIGDPTMEEIRYINKFVSDRLQYSYLFKYKPIIEAKFEDLAMNNFDSISDINEDIEQILVKLAAEIRRARLEEETSNDFDFSDPNFEDNLKELIAEIKKPTNRLKCGIKRLNEMLNGGFESGRLYLFLGITGGFKSGLLLNLFYQIKKYNTNFKPNNPDKIPTVLYITQENSMKETIERLWAIGCSEKDMKECSDKRIMKYFKNKGLLPEGESNINLRIIYRANKSISTDDLYNIYDDLMDEGKEVICVIHDYTKRIRPSMINGELRIDLSNIIDEESLFCRTKNIPFITAAQLNRKAMELIEEAINNGKKNAIDKLGASNVGESWGMLENADWVGLIHLEELADKNIPELIKRMLSLKQLKIRGKKTHVGISFVHPFTEGNDMKLYDDENDEKSASIDSLEILREGKVPVDKSGFKEPTKKRTGTSVERRKKSKKLSIIEDDISSDLSDF